MDIFGNTMKNLKNEISNITVNEQKSTMKKSKGQQKDRTSSFVWSRQNEFALLDAIQSGKEDKFKVAGASKQDIELKITEIKEQYQRSKMLTDMFISVFENEIVYSFSQAVRCFKQTPQLNMNVIYNAISHPGQFTYPMIKNIQFRNTISLRTLSNCLRNFYQMVSNCIQFTDPSNIVPEEVLHILCGNITSNDSMTEVTIHCIPKGGDIARMNGEEIHVNLYSVSYYAEMFVTLWVLYHVQHYGIKRLVTIILMIMKTMESLPAHPYYYQLISQQLNITQDEVEQIHFCGCVLKEAIKTHESQQE